jgi:hypothetical protein
MSKVNYAGNIGFDTSLREEVNQIQFMVYENLRQRHISTICL